MSNIKMGKNLNRQFTDTQIAIEHMKMGLTLNHQGNVNKNKNKRFQIFVMVE